MGGSLTQPSRVREEGLPGRKLLQPGKKTAVLIRGEFTLTTSIAQANSISPGAVIGTRRTLIGITDRIPRVACMSSEE